MYVSIYVHICLYLYCRVLLVLLCSYVTNRDHIPIPQTFPTS